MNEPIEHFMGKHGLDVSFIKQIIIGAKYSAVLLIDGHIGVCANLFNKVDVRSEDLQNPDLNRLTHRIILNAYFNARLNHLNQHTGRGDIYDHIDFGRYERPVMIGLFRPILKKFTQNNIPVRVFDMIKRDVCLTSEEKKMEYVRESDAIILSATSIANSSFSELVASTGENCDIFILGPSSIVDRDMLGYKNIKGIFGSIFKLNDERVLDAIEMGYGTRKFLPFGEKVCL
jgi:uncharacterized protein (DUF4213/DUF364 family)